MQEKVKKDPVISHAMLISDKGSQPGIDKLIDLSRFGNRNKVLRTTAWIYRFILNLKFSIKKEHLIKEEWPNVNELESTVIVLIRSINTR